MRRECQPMWTVLEARLSLFTMTHTNVFSLISALKSHGGYCGSHACLCPSQRVDVVHLGSPSQVSQLGAVQHSAIEYQQRPSKICPFTRGWGYR